MLCTKIYIPVIWALADDNEVINPKKIKKVNKKCCLTLDPLETVPDICVDWAWDEVTTEASETFKAINNKYI